MMNNSQCPLSKQICTKTLNNSQSNPKGLLFLKNYLKKILKRGIIYPNLYINENIDFVFFPRPSEAFLNNYYTLGVESEIKEWREYSNSPSLHNTASFLINKAHDLGYINKSDKENKIMDYGCGTGWFLSL